MDEKKYIEQYQFLRLSHMDIQQAIQTLDILNRYQKNDVRYALLRDFVVAYSRPFAGSKGHISKSHKLKETYVPKNLKALHRAIIKIRHQLFAHNDLTFRDPKIVNWGTLETPSFPMSFRGSGLEALDASHPDMKELAEIVLNNIRNDFIKRETRLAVVVDTSLGRIRN